MTRRILYPAAYLAVAAAAMSIQVVGARQNAVQIDADDIGGVVTSTKGPEAGVWVIAETKDLPTGFSRSVVTDDRGRYVVPDLPKANYQVFVRGYGLVDSDRVQAAPGKLLNLTAKIAPSPKDAAQYYPANYWFAMLNIPAKSEFPIQEQGATAGSEPGGVSQTAQDRRLRVVPSARQQANPRNQPGASGSSSHPKPRGPSA